MPAYPDLDELDKLWPDEGYAVIIEDEWKPPDSDDFVNILSKFSEPDFHLPKPKEGYSYWVHDADGNRYFREDWKKYKMMNSLTKAIQNVRDKEDVQKTLSDLKETGQHRWKRDDAMWFELVLSLATQGSSRGAQLVIDENDNIVQERYEQVSFETIDQMSPENRHEKIKPVLLDANVSYHNKKTEALIENFGLVKQDHGDPKGLKEEYRQKDSANEKIKFLKKFKLIGPKYARNIGMDLYHPDFRNYIAIDSRIKNIFEMIGFDYEGYSYEEQEEFLKSIADDLEIEPWELDRILYNYENEIKAEL
ncbi:hypothetical protein [Halodesulfurarchaeum formicicum]|uniref:Uncharacterized protein n=1 Tax=Halodesulfurarchaeum formicicum TaxID=1873524 RepID=A0A1J1AC23_9EURY|nr:hypothetical protein [Halodesulfurarchaeum formicicum]APE95692.1 hypothetical protein HSR6_1246 [Halodesulfurarchaeum formicicum]